MNDGMGWAGLGGENRAQNSIHSKISREKCPLPPLPNVAPP